MSEIAQTPVDANRQVFRSSLLTVWRVATMWTAAIVGGLLGVQAIREGGAPPIPQIAITLASALASALVCGVVFTLAVARLGGADHPIVRALPQEAQRTVRGN